MVNHDQLESLGSRLVGHHVLFVDIAPTLKHLQSWSMCDYAILDHHISAELELKDVAENKKIFRMDMSGCVLSWYYFYGNTSVPRVYLAVQARDLWKKDTVDQCDQLLTGLHARAGYCAACWADATFTVDDLLVMGAELENARRLRIHTYVQGATPRMWLDTRTWFSDCPDLDCISDTGAQLLGRAGCEQDIALMFRYDMDRHIYSVSLRSLVADGPDVSEIARRFGGGGHKHAAGFTYTGQNIGDLGMIIN
jgi:hypothetical protein